MITESKVTEIFGIADDFARNLKSRWQKTYFRLLPPHRNAAESA